MAREIVQTIDYAVRLNNGTGPSGNIKTVKVSLTPGAFTIDIENDDIAKALAISNALDPIFSKAVYQTQRIVTSDVVNS